MTAFKSNSYKLFVASIRQNCFANASGNIFGRHFSINQNKQNKIDTIHDVRKNLMNLIGYDRTWGDNQIDKSIIASNAIKKNQNDLEKRRMMDSYTEAIIPLGDEPLLRNRYVNFQKCVRFGRLLEDLDTMAVHISYLHNKPQNIPVNGAFLSPIVIVTVSVDQIKVNESIKLDVDKNIKLSGFTSWVGKTSAEITMKLEQKITENKWLTYLDAKFLVCARDANNKDPGIMNPLEVIDEKEKLVFELGEKNKIIRQTEAQVSLFKSPPNSVESLLVHELFKETIDLKAGTFKLRVKPPNSVWMDETMLKNIIICFPEQRNLYNKIFGGFLMRQAFELGWVNACLYCKTTPKISVVDNISFKKPVLIGSLLFLTSQIVYTQDNQMQVRVHAETVDPLNPSNREITNDFYFKFTSPPHLTLPRVMPKTYAESMMYIDGKRHMH